LVEDNLLSTSVTMSNIVTTVVRLKFKPNGTFVKHFTSKS